MDQYWMGLLERGRRLWAHNHPELQRFASEDRLQAMVNPHQTFPLLPDPLQEGEDEDEDPGEAQSLFRGGGLDPPDEYLQQAHEETGREDTDFLDPRIRGEAKDLLAKLAGLPREQQAASKIQHQPDDFEFELPSDQIDSSSRAQRDRRPARDGTVGSRRERGPHEFSPARDVSTGQAPLRPSKYSRRR